MRFLPNSAQTKFLRSSFQPCLDCICYEIELSRQREFLWLSMHAQTDEISKIFQAWYH
jgi:hypothetical protein